MAGKTPKRSAPKRGSKTGVGGARVSDAAKRSLASGRSKGRAAAHKAVAKATHAAKKARSAVASVRKTADEAASQGRSLTGALRKNSERILRVVRQVPAAAHDAIGQARGAVGVVGERAGSALDTATRAVATTAGIIVGAVEAVAGHGPVGEEAPAKKTGRAPAARRSGASRRKSGK